MIDNKLNTFNSMPVRPIPESYWIIPGRFLAGEYPAIGYADHLTRQRLDAFIEAGFDTFINLTRPGELVDYSAQLSEEAGYYGATVYCMRYPVMDFGLPTTELMTQILDGIDAALADGRKVYLHCHGGIGRTGTTVGCFLVRHGYSGKQALNELAGWWHSVPKSTYHPHSPETDKQREFVLNWQET